MGSRLELIDGVRSSKPKAASNTQATSSLRREAASAIPNGPRNSMATAMPMGMRARAS